MRPLIPEPAPSPGRSRIGPPSPVRRLLRSQRTPVTGDTPLAAHAHYVAVPVMHLEHNAVASRRRAHRRPDGERASVRGPAGTDRCLSRERSTATTGVLHDQRGDGEEIHRELLAWLGLRPRPVRAAPSGGLAAGLPDWQQLPGRSCRELAESATSGPRTLD
jgi:hypothetical protein